MMQIMATINKTHRYMTSRIVNEITKADGVKKRLYKLEDDLNP